MRQVPSQIWQTDPTTTNRNTVHVHCDNIMLTTNLVLTLTAPLIVVDLMILRVSVSECYNWVSCLLMILLYVVT